MLSSMSIGYNILNKKQKKWYENYEIKSFFIEKKTVVRSS